MAACVPGTTNPTSRAAATSMTSAGSRSATAWPDEGDGDACYAWAENGGNDVCARVCRIGAVPQGPRCQERVKGPPADAAERSRE